MKSIVCALIGFVLIRPHVTLNVAVYYEALCLDSVRFITRQLYPSFQHLQQFFNIDLIPYGKAAHSFTNGSWHFSCQHGRLECKGNKFQSCALFHTNHQRKALEFVNCVMSLRNPSGLPHMENCAKLHQLDFPSISKCFTSTEGDVVLATNGDKTWALQPGISFVPTIIFDGVYDAKVQQQSLDDFTAVVCSKIKGNQPSICNNRRLPN